MTLVRRPVTAVLSMLALILLLAIADPTGLLALVGVSGAGLRFDLGLWPLAPYFIFIPVLLAMTWWATVRAGNRFWTHVAGLVLSVLLAQAAATFAMSWDLAVAGWSAGFVTAKAVPAALIVAGLTRWLGGPRNKEFHRAGNLWVPALIFAVAAPVLAGAAWAGPWWTGAAYAPGVPVARPDSGIVSVLITVLLIAAATVFALKLLRPRVPGVLGGWLAALVAGGVVGLIQATVGLLVDGGFAGDIWPVMVAYVTVSDGLSFGATIGWLVGIVAVVTDRYAGKVPATTAVSVGAAASAFALVAALGLPAITSAVASPEPTAPEAAAGYLRTQGSIIVDGNGNQVLMRGANVNQLVDFYQHDPTMPTVRPLTEQDYSDMASYGFNVVRLNLSWSALEPERGQLDTTYLAKIKQAVQWGKNHGIYTVLDMHQDGWWNGPSTENQACRPGTEPMWGYDGAPE